MSVTPKKEMYLSIRKLLAALRLVSKCRNLIDKQEGPEEGTRLFSRLRGKLDGVDDSIVQTGFGIFGARGFEMMLKGTRLCRYYSACIDRQLEAHNQTMLRSLAYALINARQAEVEVVTEEVTTKLTAKEARTLSSRVVSLRQKIESMWPEGVDKPSQKTLAA